MLNGAVPPIGAPVLVKARLLLSVKNPVIVDTVMLVPVTAPVAVSGRGDVILATFVDWTDSDVDSVEAFCGCLVRVKLPVAGTLVSEELLIALVGRLMVMLPPVTVPDA